MKNYTLLLFLFILGSCSSDTKLVEEIAPAVTSGVIDSVAIHIDAITEQLERSDILEQNIKSSIKSSTTLKEQNTQLKKELLATRDSIYTLKRELVEIKSKLPKKKNLIQKLFNITPDSIDIITIDTIEVRE